MYSKADKKKPKFSVVIALAPWRNAEILEYLKKQDFPKKDYEIIIKKGLNVPDNRNNGVKSARGDIVLFLDDDAIIEIDFLRKVDNFFKDHKDIDVLGGPQLTPDSDNYFGKLNGYVLGSFFSSGRESKRYKKAKLSLDANSSYITGALLISRKKVLKKIKFDRDQYPGDDINFVNLAKTNGYKIAYSPDIFIYHMRRPNIKSFVKQIFDYAKVRTTISFPPKDLKNFIYLVPALFVIYVLFLPIMLIVNLLF